MPVYVDPELAWVPQANWPWDSVTHLYADTEAELHAFAARLGLRREWCSDHTQPGARLLHYDLNARKRAQAVRLGAIEVDHQHKQAYFPPITHKGKRATGVERGKKPTQGELF